MLLKKVFPNLLPLVLFFIFESFSINEVYLSLMLVVILAVSFYFKYTKGEFKLFLFGGVIGFIIEFLLGLIGRSQFWVNTYFAIPVWLPLAWGAGFIYIRRLGNIIIEGS